MQTDSGGLEFKASKAGMACLCSPLFDASAQDLEAGSWKTTAHMSGSWCSLLMGPQFLSIWFHCVIWASSQLGGWF